MNLVCLKDPKVKLYYALFLTLKGPVLKLVGLVPVSALSKSLWTLMMKDLFKYVPTSPYTFLGGLMLISELLPLPLPIQTREVRA